MPLCVVAGAGPGLGASLAKRFAREGFDCALLARDAARLEAIGASVMELGVAARAYSVDLCDPRAVVTTFEQIKAQQGDADVLIYNAARWQEAPTITLDPATFNTDLALGATGALVCAQQVYAAMEARGHGSVLFTGGGLALHPEWGAGVASLSAGKAALRAVAYALAAELKPAGVHVATVTVAGTIAPSTPFDPDRIAETYWTLHCQPPSSWTTEIVFDGRP